MASSWGSSWGTAWGNSWGSVEGGGGEEPPPSDPGVGAGGGFSRGQWRKYRKKKEDEWRAAVEAHKAAEEKALQIKSAKKQQAALEVLALADRVISEAARREEIKLGELTSAMDAAALARKWSEVRRISEEWLQRIEDEEDEDAIEMILMRH